jgi:glycosyltransferase involved in cell wall biosynthesis
VTDELRVGVDLSGPKEPLGNFTEILADTLMSLGLCFVRRFRTSRGEEPVDDPIGSAWLWGPMWRRSRGRPIDRWIRDVDVVHLSGRATPPSATTPLIITVDDLRPLRDDAEDRLRVAQLRRAVDRGAQLVATSRIASLEVQRVLGLARENVVVVAPPVAWDRDVATGTNVVVNLTGRTPQLLALAPALSAFAASRGARVVVLASHEAAARIRAAGADVDLEHRSRAATVLDGARVVVHLTDGARFPSFAVAAMAAGVPVCSTPTELNRELLEGAATFADDADSDAFAGIVLDAADNDSRRAVMIAAGRARARDFAPVEAARSYAELYHGVVRRMVRR